MYTLHPLINIVPSSCYKEEAASFFSDQETAAEVTDIVENRVGAYVKESNGVFSGFPKIQCSYPVLSLAEERQTPQGGQKPQVTVPLLSLSNPRASSVLS
jgi:hypothetical protein